MRYKIAITGTAERDLIHAADHIEFVLKNPQAADALLEEAERQINSLSRFPEKHQLVDDPVLSLWGIRFIAVKGYLAFYIISDVDTQVTVVRFLYQKSDWGGILRQGLCGPDNSDE